MKKEQGKNLTTKKLPHTRMELFWDLVKTQKRQMVSFSMLVFVFMLPLVIDILLFNQFIIGASMTIDDIGQRSSTIFSFRGTTLKSFNP